MGKRDFYYNQDFDAIDFRKNPELYRIGKGEQGVLSVEPYKSEILPHWRFKTPDIAKKSADTIYDMFLAYKKQEDFVGMDMARKFLQMGWTRSRRYANHKSGKKYSWELSRHPKEVKPVLAYKDKPNQRHYFKTRINAVLPLDPDSEKARSAAIFYERYQEAKNDPVYLKLKAHHKSTFEI